MTRTVVTGAGFIGKRLLEKLGARHIAHQDIHSSTYQDYDKLFFLSTYGNMAHHRDHEMMLRANVEDLTFILSNFFKGWLCYASSSSVTLPVQTSYSRFKRAGEEIALGYPDIQACVVRPYSVVGIGEQKQHLIPTLIRSCMEGVPMDFDASPVHDFIDIEDVVNGLIALADDKATGVHEFGSGVPTSNQHIRELVEQACGKKANIQSHLQMRAYDNREWYCKNPSPYFKHTKSVWQSISEMVKACA
jgi:nucleoside-diphosphate-sugar epimerase